MKTTETIYEHYESAEWGHQMTWWGSVLVLRTFRE